MSTESRKKPVTVITGCLGSGKTTLLAKALKSPSMKNTAVLVNEFGKVGLDHHLLKRIDENTILLGGGCVCCTTRDDLVRGLKDLLDQSQLDNLNEIERVVVETTGLADPAPILFTILHDPVLQHHFYIDNVIVTVDAVNGQLHLDRQLESIKQVAVADKIIVTKTDIASSEELNELLVRLTTLNPSAEIITATFGEIDPELLFNRSSRNHIKVDLGKKTRIASTSAHEDSHTSDVRSISITFEEPLDWTAFGLWLSMLLHARGEDVLRVKGLVNVGEEGPVVLNGVQHIIHPPDHLESWPSNDKRSKMIFIIRKIEQEDILRSLEAFQYVLGARPTLLNMEVRMG
jgi:G3E family GTPase